MSIIQVAKDAILGKKVEEFGKGNALWRQTVIAPLAAAAKLVKLNKNAIESARSPAEVGLERRRAAKRNRKRQIQKLSRRRNRR